MWLLTCCHLARQVPDLCNAPATLIGSNGAPHDGIQRKGKVVWVHWAVVGIGAVDGVSLQVPGAAVMGTCATHMAW